MKKNVKKILLPILGFSTIAISTPIIITSCSTSSNTNIIKFDDFTPVDLAGIQTYSFSSGANEEWKSKSKEDVYKELKLTDVPGTAGSGLNKDFRDEAIFKSMINGLTFSTLNQKSLAWTDIDTSAINNPNAKVSVMYISVPSVSNTIAVTWILDKISVVFSISSAITQNPIPPAEQN